MRQLTPLDNELLRKALLRYLAMHHPAGFTATSLAAIMQPRGLLDYEPTEEATDSALNLLKDLSLIKEVTDPLGSSAYWSCTAAGKLAIERDEI